MSDLEQAGLVYAPHNLGRGACRRKGVALLRRCADADRAISTDNDRNAIEAQVAASGHAKSVETVLTEASGLLSGLTRARRRPC